MTRILSYVIKNDSGAAPNPFWGVCTLTICKPSIHRTAEIGDWIIGTGSKNTKLKDGQIHDLSACIVYAMKVTDIKSFFDYDILCKSELNEKIPQWFSKDWRKRMGDCIYDYSVGSDPKVRKGVHGEKSKARDLRGENALISNHFYYFGEEARMIPHQLRKIIKKSQGHLKIEDPTLINRFLKWIKTFKKNKIYADSQRKYIFDLSGSTDIQTKILCGIKDKDC
jgi:hypothetical protein